jgi:hypothetical protein
MKILFLVAGVGILSCISASSFGQGTPVRTIPSGESVQHNCPPGKKAFFDPQYNASQISGGRAWCYSASAPGQDTSKGKTAAQTEQFKPDNWATYYQFASKQGYFRYQGTSVLVISN